MLRAAALADAGGTLAAPGAVLVRLGFDPDHPHAGELLAAGDPGTVAAHEAAARALTVDLPRAVLLPALVNAHTHLDLTHVGPRPVDPDDPDGFVTWIGMVRRNRATTEPDISASVRAGAALSLAGGVVAVGDIAGAARGRPTLAPWRALEKSGLTGVSFIEFFALGPGARGVPAQVRALIEDAHGGGAAPVRAGLQPHAPYTVSPAALIRAAELARDGGPGLSVHLAESAPEHRLIARGDGPLRAMLIDLGVWSEQDQAAVGHGQSPVAHAHRALATAPFLAAHVNDASEADIALLASTGTTVAYCPRASEYFGAARVFGPHRYRDMLAAGVRVCLGTDSVINLPAASSDPERDGLSTLDEARLLVRRDGVDPRLALGMATTAGAAALGLDPDRFRLAGSERGAKPVAGLVAVEIAGPARAAGHGALGAVMASDSRPVLLTPGRLLGRTVSCRRE